LCIVWNVYSYCVLLHVTWPATHQSIDHNTYMYFPWHLINWNRHANHVTPDYHLYGDLTPTIMLYYRDHMLLYLTCSSCYYIHVNPRKSIIMNIIYNNWTTYTKTGETDEINMCMRLQRLNIAQMEFWFYLSATRCFGRVYWHPCSRFHISGHTITHFDFVVSSGSVPDAHWPLSRVCTGPNINIVHWSSISFQ